jgi:hypothetical protein
MDMKAAGFSETPVDLFTYETASYYFPEDIIFIFLDVTNSVSYCQCSLVSQNMQQ